MTAIAKRKRRPPGPATDRQLEVLAAIKRLTAEKGYAPTMRELMAACGLASTFGMSCHLDALEKRGLIRRTPFTSRSIVVVEQEGGDP